MNKVAIIQNRLQRGGRLQVMMYMIKVMNSMDIVPDILTLSSRISVKDASESYGMNELQFRIIPVLKDFKMPFEWNILYFNRLVNKHLKAYHLVINSNNTSFLLRADLNLMSYIHFPRKARNRSKKKDIHFPKGENKSIWHYKLDLFKIAAFLYRFDKKVRTNELIIANSEFTKQNILDQYDLKKEKIQILYPPISFSQINQTKEQNSVISLGRFSPDKRQMEQIMIAEKLPDYQFNLVGFVNSENYFNECQKYIEDRNIQNVKLHRDQSIEKVLELLSRSQYFIHNLRNEPFGITTVQGIQNGCIPVVHNSGGQKEIVPIDVLRFNNELEAIEIFKSFQSKSVEQQTETLKKLQENVSQYRSKEFERQFKELLSNKLS